MACFRRACRQQYVGSPIITCSRDVSQIRPVGAHHLGRSLLISCQLQSNRAVSLSHLQGIATVSLCPEPCARPRRHEAVAKVASFPRTHTSGREARLVVTEGLQAVSRRYMPKVSVDDAGYVASQPIPHLLLFLHGLLQYSYVFKRACCLCEGQQYFVRADLVSLEPTAAKTVLTTLSPAAACASQACAPGRRSPHR